MPLFKKSKDKDKAEKGKGNNKKDGKKTANGASPLSTHQRSLPNGASSDGPVQKATDIRQNGNISKEAADYAQGTATFHHPLMHNANHPFARVASPKISSAPPHDTAPFGRSDEAPSPHHSNVAAELSAGYTHVSTAKPNGQSQNVDNLNSRVIARNAEGYFLQPGGTDRPSDEGRTSEKDLAYANPHQPSSDSGYDSIPQSTEPSESAGWHENGRNSLATNNQTFLPHLSLGEDLAQDPTLSDLSWAGDLPSTSFRLDSVAQDWPLHETKEASSPDASKVVQPSQSAASDSTLQPLNHLQHGYLGDNANNSRENVTAGHGNHHDLYNLSLPDHTAKTEPSMSAQAHSTQGDTFHSPRPHFHHPIRNSTPPTQVSDQHRVPHEPDSTFPGAPYEGSRAQQEQFTLPNSILSAQDGPGSEQADPYPRYVSPIPTHNYSAPLDRIVSMSRQSTLSPIAKLEGCKVNKRGKILDEEGDVIGQLIEGDIMDCVRQRCNAHGEVLDDYGRVVGRVQLVERSMDSPVLAPVTPAQSIYQQSQSYFPDSRARQNSFSQTSSPPAQPNPNRVSRQPEIFTPAWQRQSHLAETGLAKELRDHLASTSTEPQEEPIVLSNSSSNVAPVELDATEPTIERDDDSLPLFDHSDVFIPPPRVPLRSTLRSGTPSPPVEKLRREDKPLVQARPSEPMETPQAQSTARTLFLKEAEPAEPTKRVPAEPQSGTEASASEKGRVAPPPAPTTAPTTASTTAPTTAPTSAPASAPAVREEPTPTSSEGQKQRAPPPPTVVRQFEPKRTSRTAKAPVRSSEGGWTGPGAAQFASLQEPASSPSPTSGSSLSSSRLRESSHADNPKSYVRPTMSPVPEGGQSTSKRKVVQLRDGDDPVDDMLAQQPDVGIVPGRGKAAPLPAFPRQAFTGGPPTAPRFAPMNSAQFSSAGGLGPRGAMSRQSSVGMPGPRPSLSAKNSYHQPLKRSPLSSNEITPPESESGTANDNTDAVSAYSYQPSVRTLSSMQALSAQRGGNKPRTYFTHSGRVTVDAGSPTPAQSAATAAATKSSDAASIASAPASQSGKKKNRFSLSFGGKKGQTAKS